jgi:predicted nucleotidyltransferase
LSSRGQRPAKFLATGTILVDPMFALSQCDLQNYPALRDVLPEDYAVEAGFAVRWRFSSTGWYVVFEFPDLPDNLREESTRKVVDIHSRSRHLRQVAEGSPEWNEAFQGLSNDLASSRKIFDSFQKHFGIRLRWVKTTRRPRGLVSAMCLIDNLGEVTLQVTWRDVWAGDLERLPEADRPRFEAAIRDTLLWGQHRIQPVLDALNERLSELYGNRFRGLFVFGSYARPDTGIELPESSDLDVALILSDFDNVYDERKRIGDITYDLSLEHGLVISVVPIREADFREGRTNFTRGISQYAVPVPVK